MEQGKSPYESASIEDIRQAIEDLTEEDRYRLHKAARICLSGTEFRSSDEMINEVIVRTMKAANGEKGRRWPTQVKFIAYLIQTMKSLASDSRESLQQKNTTYLVDMIEENVNTEEVLSRHQYHHADVVTQAIETGEIQDRCERAKVDLDKIDAYFAGDSEVIWIIMGYKDELPASKVRDLGEMTQIQYETARKRFRRGLEKIFPDRRKV